MSVCHPVSTLVTRREVNFPAASRIPDLVDLDLVTVSGQLQRGRQGRLTKVR
jgi:hypothetical protein